MNVENLKISELKPYENNPRKNDESVEYVANSIKEFGFKVPIIVDKNNVIVCGHTRYKAAKKIGMQEVPCIRADDLSDEQIKAFRLADNKVSEMSGWDFEALGIEMSDIGMDMQQFGLVGVDVDFSYIDDMLQEDLSSSRENPKDFVITLCFPSAERENVEKYLAKIGGKKKISDKIIEEASHGD